MVYGAVGEGHVVCGVVGEGRVDNRERLRRVQTQLKYTLLIMGISVKL